MSKAKIATLNRQSKKSNRKQGRQVWVVMHYEVLGPRRRPYFDALQFHVASSLKGAETWIRSVGVESHSWWQVHPYIIDDQSGEEGDQIVYFSYRGKRLAAAPQKRALAAYDKLPASRFKGWG
ncbi:MAG: hypothetical protein JSS27_01590 [Planctomycetes bacterium]|nr:hypothetical protein [Planctomycetota bacterium]